MAILRIVVRGRLRRRCGSGVRRGKPGLEAQELRVVVEWLLCGTEAAKHQHATLGSLYGIRNVASGSQKVSRAYFSPAPDEIGLARSPISFEVLSMPQDNLVGWVRVPMKSGRYFAYHDNQAMGHCATGARKGIENLPALVSADFLHLDSLSCKVRSTISDL